MSGWRRSVCDCGCGDPSVCEGGGCGRCETTTSCGDGTACPATYAVTVNVPSITLENSTSGCPDITFSSFAASGVLIRHSSPPDPPSITRCQWSDGSGDMAFIGDGGGSQTISGCSDCASGVTIDKIGVWASFGFSEQTIGGARGRMCSSSVQLRLYYDGAYHDGGCAFGEKFWLESDQASPAFIEGCGCDNGFTTDAFSVSHQFRSDSCSCYATLGTHPAVTWAIS